MAPIYTDMPLKDRLGWLRETAIGLKQNLDLEARRQVRKGRAIAHHLGNANVEMDKVFRWVDAAVLSEEAY